MSEFRAVNDDLFSCKMDDIYKNSTQREKNGLNRISSIIDRKIDSCFEWNASGKNITLEECKKLVYSEIDDLPIDEKLKIYLRLYFNKVSDILNPNN